MFLFVFLEVITLKYLSSQLQEFMIHQGIIHHTSCPYTPQQNKVAERKSRHHIETACILLIGLYVPLHFWAMQSSLLATFFYEVRWFIHKNTSRRCIVTRKGKAINKSPHFWAVCILMSRSLWDPYTASCSK